MKPWKTLAKAKGPDGNELVLQERDGVFVIRVGGVELMSSARHASEEAMAEAGLAGLRAKAPRVLIGGLGLGYTLRAVLDRVSSRASVVVAEISDAVLEWNRGPLAPLAGSPLLDSRVIVRVADVRELVADASEGFDSILLDVDNGPVALSRAANQHLYGSAGLKRLHAALRPGGRLVVWSAGSDRRFVDKLREAEFRQVREISVAARTGAGASHVLFVAELPS